MRFSFVVPAYNAVGTLAQTLDSLVRQSCPDWESIVVDDGSRDETGKLAFAYAMRDSRIRVLRQKNAGMGAARNAGLREARGEWVIFLDADDWMDPEAVARFSEAAAADPEAGAVYGGWARVAAGGEVVKGAFPPSPTELFSVVARFCPFAIHSCAVRRNLIDELHGFDPEFRYCADWDLWQRMARLGTRIAVTDSIVAFYRMSTGSSVVNVEGITAEGMEIIARGHRRDPRVLRPDSQYAEGVAKIGLAAAQLGFLCWQAGIVLGLGVDARPLFRVLDPDARDPELEPARVAHALHAAIPLSRSLPPSEWSGLWAEISTELGAFLSALEAHALAPGLARRTQKVLERLVVDAASVRPLTIGRCHAVRLEVTEPLGDLDMPTGVDRLLCALTLEGDPLGELELPAIGNRVPAKLLADAIVANHAWPILNRFFSRTIYPALEREVQNGRMSITREGTLLVDGLADADPGSTAFHEAIGWTVFLQELWGLPAWGPDRFYSDTLEEETPEIRVIADDTATVELCEPLTALATPRMLEIEWTLAGFPVYFAQVEPVDGRIGSRRLRALVTQAVGYELARLVVREVLLGTSLEDPANLRERLVRSTLRNRREAGEYAELRVTAAPLTRLAPSWRCVVTRALAGSGGVALFRHAGSAPGTSISRRALLPAASVREVMELALAGGEPIASDADNPEGPVIHYVPEALWLKPFQGVAESEPSQPATGYAEVTGALPAQRSDRLPILLYHQIAHGKPGPLARYRVSPESFAAQIRHLREAGFRSVTLGEWAAAMRRYEPMEGRPILITFDDGYRDFSEAAWPVLKHHGFGALVFLVSERIGGISEWTSSYGETAALLDWAEIRRLRDEGVEFGSHSATHPHFEALSPADIVKEAARSRAVLQRGLEAPVTALAYPNGSEDAAIQHLVGACGYVYGLSCRRGLSSFGDPLLALPRIEIQGDDEMADFVKKLQDGVAPYS